MNPISTIELNKIRSDAYRAVFDKKCTISRESQVFDSKGGSPDNYIDIADNIPCAMVGLSMPVQQMLAGQNVGIDARTLHAPFGTDIMVNDEVTINNVIYRVLAPYGEKTIQIFTSVIIQKRTMA